MIEALKRNLRWDSWAQGKLPWLCSIMYYLIFKNSFFSKLTVIDFTVFICFSIVSSIYGYLINDLFDIEIDRKHNKPNVFARIGVKNALMLVALSLIISICLGIRFVSRPYFTLFWILWMFLATFYSARPLRFKEKGMIGLISAFVSQYPLPVLLCFCAFNNFGAADMWGVALFTALSGAALEIGHQRFDLENDRKTDTNTFAVTIGKDKVDLLYKLFTIFDLLAVMIILLIMAFNTNSQIIFGKFNIFILPILIYFALCFIVLKIVFGNGFKQIDPYYVEGRQDIFNITYTLFPNFFLPFYLGMLLVIKSFTLLPIFLAFMLITYINFPKANFFWQIRLIFDETLKLTKKVS